MGALQIYIDDDDAKKEASVWTATRMNLWHACIGKQLQREIKKHII